MRISRLSRSLAIGLLTVGLAALSACGAGSRTGAQTAATVACDFENPSQPTTVNVLAYNSSAVDPFTNTMVKNCTRDNVTVKHDPIDFGGQVQKTVATLSGDKGSYDIIETYGYIIPTYAAQGSLQPLDDLFAKYKDKYKLGDINEDMRKSMSYDGKLYGLPMQAQVLVLAYRKDVFDKLGLKPPTTFEELRDVSKKIQDAVPAGAALAGQRRYRHRLRGRARLSGGSLRRRRQPESQLHLAGVDQGPGADEVLAPLHGSAGHHL
jgi:multiple sugar transport system substrate-binding protein